tara:strand:+ start:3679 stop:3924 length:246 start_codon:yes stop_codon:yes gene_type:complete
MKFVRYASESGPCEGVVCGDEIVDLRALPEKVDTLSKIMRRGTEFIQIVEETSQAANQQYDFRKFIFWHRSIVPQNFWLSA